MNVIDLTQDERLFPINTTGTSYDISDRNSAILPMGISTVPSNPISLCFSMCMDVDFPEELPTDAFDLPNNQVNIRTPSINHSYPPMLNNDPGWTTDGGESHLSIESKFGWSFMRGEFKEPIYSELNHDNEEEKTRIDYCSTEEPVTWFGYVDPEVYSFPFVIGSRSSESVTHFACNCNESSILYCGCASIDNEASKHIGPVFCNDWEGPQQVDWLHSSETQPSKTTLCSQYVDVSSCTEFEPHSNGCVPSMIGKSLHLNSHYISETMTFDADETMTESLINPINHRIIRCEVERNCSRCNPIESEPSTSTLSLNSTLNVCPVCFRAYARPSTLKMHLLTHSGFRPYQCAYCTKKFSQAANLTAHMRTHSGERPFQCPVCSRKFTQSSSVTTHLRTHSRERPYMCRVCFKSFSDSSTLTKHFRVHSGEKPYKCLQCTVSFSQSGNLKRHIRSHLEKK